MGGGYFSLSLVNKGLSGVGISVDQGEVTGLTNVLNSRQIKEEKLKILKLDARKATELDRKFDLILAFEVIEHIKADLDVIKIFSQVQPNKGRLLLSVPNKIAWVNINKNDYGEEPEHVRPGYTFPELKKLLEEGGYKVLEEYGIGGLLTQTGQKLQEKSMLKKLSGKLWSYLLRLITLAFLPLTALEEVIPTPKELKGTLVVLAEKV